MRIGLVGYGHGGRHFHAPLIASLPGATFVGVVTRSAERRQLLAAEHPGVRAFDSIEQLVAAGVDGLVISTPLEGRAALVLEAIERGVPVVSDKPFASDVEQARALIDAAATRRVPLSLYMNRRWDSDFLTLRKLIDSGTLGSVSRFESRVERYVPQAVGNASGGGFLRDLGRPGLAAVRPGDPGLRRVAVRRPGADLRLRFFPRPEPCQWRGFTFVR